MPKETSEVKNVALKEVWIDFMERGRLQGYFEFILSLKISITHKNNQSYMVKGGKLINGVESSHVISTINIWESGSYK